MSPRLALSALLQLTSEADFWHPTGGRPAVALPDCPDCGRFRRGLGPAAAAAARRDRSSTLRPMARRAARSGRTSTTRAPAAVSAAACRWGLVMWPAPLVTGATMTTRWYPAARSALAIERIPPSMNRRSPMVTGGQTPGTAQLAPTASTRPASPAASNTTNSPVRASTAVTFRDWAGQPPVGSRASITLRRSASGMVRAPSGRSAPAPVPSPGWCS